MHGTTNAKDITNLVRPPFCFFFVNLEYLELLNLEGVGPYGWNFWFIEKCKVLLLEGVPLVTEPGISLITLTQMKILQRNLNSSTFVV
jgi:hypothetical protein